jgi:hypothetical protein
MNIIIQNATRSGVFNRTQKLIGALTVCLGVATAFQASASFSLGDAANYAVLYEGGGGQTLSFNNSLVTGNFGIGLTGQAQLNGPGTITGSFNFSAANTGQYSDSGVTVTGGVHYNVADVTTALNTVNTLSQTLGGESGNNVAITSGGLINVSAGLVQGGDSVFTVTSVSFANGTLTINGDGIHNVVFNIPGSIGGVSFNGAIVLTGGLTSDQVLFNMTGGNYSTLTGGNKLTISTSGLTTTGTFLDPNGDFSMNHSVLNGRLFGGDSKNSSVVSGAEINAPPPAVPEPTTFIAGALLLLPLGASTVRILRRKATA